VGTTDRPTPIALHSPKMIAVGPRDRFGNRRRCDARRLFGQIGTVSRMSIEIHCGVAGAVQQSG